MADDTLVIERLTPRDLLFPVLSLPALNPGECRRYAGRMGDDFAPGESGSFVVGYVPYGQVFSLDMAAGQCVAVVVTSATIQPAMAFSGPGPGGNIDFLGGQGVRTSSLIDDMVKTSDSTLIASSIVQLSVWDTGPSTDYFVFKADPITRATRDFLGVKGAWDPGVGAFQLDLRSC